LVVGSAAVRAAALVAGPAVVRVEQIASVAGICHAAAVETGAPLAELEEVDSMDPVHAVTAAAAPPASDLEVGVEEALVAAAEVLVAEDLEVEEALVAAAEVLVAEVLVAEVPVVVAPVVVVVGADRGSNP
jgi:hypothetical protein